METYDMDVFFPGDIRVDAEIHGVRIPTGGEGEPSPFDLFLAGIGTCSGIKVLRFCQERGLPAENLRIKQRMFYSPDSNMIEKIELDIQLPPGFPEKYHDAVIRAANTCGVKRHLVHPPEFDVHVSVMLST
jgi:ribosomal protein S12 methylthiotransferase accessory factor